MLDGNDAVYPVRCLGREENVAELPPVSRALAFAERVRCLHEQAVQTAERQRVEAEERHAGMCADAALWPHLLELAERQEQLAEELAALARRRAGIPDAVTATISRLLVGLEREGGEGVRATAGAPSADSHLEAALLAVVRANKESQARLEEAMADLAGQMLSSKNRLACLNAELEALAPLAEAKAGRRWWRLRWWRAAFRGDVAAQAADVQARLRLAQEELARLEGESARLGAERRQAEEKERADRAAQTDAEIARLDNDLGAHEAALLGERDLVDS